MRSALTLLLMTAALGPAGCASKKNAATLPATTTTGGARAATTPAAATSGVHVDDAGDATPPVFHAVYFPFDDSALSPAARAELEQLADWLGQHARAAITVEGHADERGTAEYNLGLGDRRATVIRDYLRHLGVPAARIRTISYGEERPAIAGSDESAWSQNRRGELVFER